MSLLPTLPVIDEAVLDRSQPRPYDGPIEPGMIFAWEPELPHARELCIVTRIGPAPPPLVAHHARGTAVISQGHGDVIWTLPLDQSVDEREVWNEFSRFREAVVPTLFKPQSLAGRRVQSGPLRPDHHL